MRTYRVAIVLVLGVFGAAPSLALEVERATGEITIDGSLDEAAWSSALKMPLPYEWFPGDNVPALVETEFFVTYDEHHLYIAWRCHDPRPAEIRANLMDRDAIDTLVQDDHVAFLVDPFNDGRRGFQFRINPFGVQADAFNSDNEGIEDWSFDMIWASAGRITAGGYEVEAQIPFSQLRFPGNGEIQTWGLEAGRSYPRAVRHRLLTHTRDRNRNCTFCEFNKVTGFQGMKAGRNLELDPTATAVRTDRRQPFPDGGFSAGDEETDLGLSARWGITPNWTLSGALNPDFSQVEADAAQLDVNRRFALFFPEKRPFFLEGVDLFATPIQTVFTRTVIDPDWGLKLSGKAGANALGLFATRDTANGFLIPGRERSAAVFLDDEKVTGSVLRYRRDFGQGSSAGLIYAGREGDDYANRVTGADAFWRINQTNTVTVQFLRSETEYPREVAEQFAQELGTFSGEALLADWDYATRDWVASLRYEDRDPLFRADSGFVPQVDLRQLEGFLTRNLYREGKRIHRLSVGLHVLAGEDHDGVKGDEAFEASGELQGPAQSFLRAVVHRKNSRLGGTLFRDLDSLSIFGEIQPSGRLRATLFVEGGDDLDVVGVREARSLLVNPAAELKLGRHVNAQLTHTYQRLTHQGDEIFTANLSQLRLVYNFNVRSLVRLVLQYFDLERDPRQFPFPVERSSQELFTQGLFSYKLNAQTVLFAGYSDNSLGTEDLSLTRADRTFFLKVGYAWAL